MAATGMRAFDETIQETHVWLNEISRDMNHPDKQIAYHALRGTLATLRDRLPPDEAVQLAAQLPLLVRGIFFDGYHAVSNRPIKYTRDEFIDEVNQHLQHAGGADPVAAVTAVFGVLSRHVSAGEIAQVYDALPKELQRLWPAEVASRRPESA